MKSKIKSIICLILAVVMVASLSACAGASVSASINDEGEFVYTVTRSIGATPEAETGAKDIRAALKKTFDCKINIKKDVGYEDFDGNYEILVGDTLREESKIAKQKLLDNRVNCASDFIVCVIDDKICIQVVNNVMITKACEWFMLNFCNSKEDWSKLRKNYEFIYAEETAALNNTVAGVNLCDFTVVLPRKTSLLHGLIVDEYIEYYDQHDYILKEAEDMDAEAEYEILVGDCDRDASKSVTVEGDNYVIKVVGKKLVIKGGTHLATWRGFKALLDEIKACEGKEVGINWADGYVVNGKYDANEKGAFTLNWGDEFEGSTIDRSKWGDYNGKSLETAASCLGGTVYTVSVGGKSKYTGSDAKDLIHQTGGELVCGTKRISDIDFIGSQISSYYTMTFKYGCMDIYSKLAKEPAYTTYWANGGGTANPEFIKRFGGTENDRVCMTEIDILENYSRPHEYGSTVHWWWSAFNADGSKNSAGGHAGLGGNALYKKGSENSMYLVYDQEKYGDLLPDDYHMYSFYWDDECIKFAFDGKVFMDYQYTNHESVSVHCLMNYLISSCSMGSATYGYTYSKDQHENYYEHKIDYIRLYQTDAKNSQMITAWPETQKNGTSVVRYPENSIGSRY
ncbi:MAG: hypothetical protein E7565_02225 [Ruminococcaceae bacterium]|nr:hypothetical protein [Oscillospiraceae bacterium]